MRIRKMEERDFDAVHLLFEQVHALHVENRPDVYRNTDPLPRARFEECSQMKAPPASWRRRKEWLWASVCSWFVLLPQNL